MPCAGEFRSCWVRSWNSILRGGRIEGKSEMITVDSSGVNTQSRHRAKQRRKAFLKGRLVVNTIVQSPYQAHFATSAWGPELLDSASIASCE